jgi:ribosome-dependent ATPase
MFFTMIGTMIPATQFSGLLTRCPRWRGGPLIGGIYPATHMLIISRGVFNKALGFSDLYASTGRCCRHPRHSRLTVVLPQDK